MVREEIVWRALEYAEGKYNWSQLDLQVLRAREAGVEPVVLLFGYSPGTWTSTRPLYASSSADAKLRGYSNFLTEMVRRYKGRVRYWQIENEVTLKEFWGAPLDDYVAILKTAYQTIKREDPAAKVLLAGFTDVPSPDNVRFLVEQGRGYFDILDMHTYKAPETIASDIGFFNGLMRQAGYERPVWVMETGAPNPCRYTSASEPPPEVQAAEIVKRYAIALTAGAKRVFWFYLGGPIPADDLVWTCTRQAQNSGLNFRHMALVRNNERRLAFTTYQVMVQKLQGFTVSDQLDMGSSVSAYRFRKSAGDVFVLWAQKETTVKLPLGARSVTVTDVAGKARQADPGQLSVGPTPVFVE